MKAHVRCPDEIYKAIREQFAKEKERNEKIVEENIKKQYEQALADFKQLKESQSIELVQRCFNMFALAMAKSTRCKPDTVRKIFHYWDNNIAPRWNHYAEQPDDDGHTSCDAWVEMELEKMGFPCLTNMGSEWEM